MSILIYIDNFKYISISKNYDDQLVHSDESMRLGEEVRQKLVQTRQSVLDVTKSTNVAGIHVALQRASNSIRSPYVDPLNVIQAGMRAQMHWKLCSLSTAATIYSMLPSETAFGLTGGVSATDRKTRCHAKRSDTSRAGRLWPHLLCRAPAP